MSFVQSGMLAALGALAIPIIIHLMFRRRARPVDLGTLQFLKVVLRDNSRRRRVKRYLLLSIRLACVALIALLFARPFLPAAESGEGGRLVVVLVDRSASMGLAGGPRPIDRASAEVRSILAKSGRGTRLEVAEFDRDVRPIPKAADAPKAVAEPTPAGTDVDAAMAWARDVLAGSPGLPRELVIVTDLRRSGLGRGEPARVPGGVAVRLVNVGRPFSKDVGVVAVAASPPDLRPRTSATVTVRLRNAGPLPVEKLTVRLHLAAEGLPPVDLDRAVDIDGNGSAAVEFPLPEMEEGTWRGYVEVPAGDDFPADDRRYFALPVAPASRILLVDGDPGRSAIGSETYFLGAALRLAPPGETDARAAFDPVVFDPSATRDALPDLSRTAAVVLANVADLPAADAKALAAFVRDGGGLVVFTGDRVTAEGVASLAEVGLGVGRVVGPDGQADRVRRIDGFDGSHPIFRPFADPEHGDVRRPAFATITKIIPDPDARVLARFAGGDPALIERAVGRGRVLWFASACDRSWGDWPRSRMYLPMVHQIVAHASGLTDGGRIRAEVADRDHPIGLSEAGGILRVANLDPSESDLARSTPQEFAGRYGFALPDPSAEPRKPELARKPGDDRLRPDEAWPWLGLVLVGALLFEQFLANRTAA